MFTKLRARLAAWIAPTNTATATPAPAPAPAPATTDNSIAGGVHDSARVVQARDIATLNTGDTHTHTHTGPSTHHHGATNTVNGDVHGGNVVMAHQMSGIGQITGTTGDISWGNVINNGPAGVQAGHVSGGTIIA